MHNTANVRHYIGPSMVESAEYARYDKPDANDGVLYIRTQSDSTQYQDMSNEVCIQPSHCQQEPTPRM